MPCTEWRLTRAQLNTFRARDAANPAKGGITAVRALDGSRCDGASSDGVSSDGERCVDFARSTPLLTDGSLAHDGFAFLPRGTSRHPISRALRRAAALQHDLGQLQRSACQSGAQSPYYLHALPQVGFGSVIEYAAMFLGRALYLNAPFFVGADSSRAWTSRWYCGEQRSLACYFNLTECCGVVTVGGGPTSTCWPSPLCQSADCMPRCRRDPLNVGVAGRGEYGAAWLSAQLLDFLWRRLTPRVHACRPESGMT